MQYLFVNFIMFIHLVCTWMRHEEIPWSLCSPAHSSHELTLGLMSRPLPTEVTRIDWSPRYSVHLHMYLLLHYVMRVGVCVGARGSQRAPVGAGSLPPSPA